MPCNVRVTVTGNLTLGGGSATVLIGSNTGNTGTYGILSFDGGGQLLGGSGSVVFGSSTNNSMRAGPTANSALTIGPNVTVQNATNSLFTTLGEGSVGLTIQGKVLAHAKEGKSWMPAYADLYVPPLATLILKYDPD